MKKLRSLLLTGLFAALCAAAFVACEEDPTLPDSENPPLINVDTTLTTFRKPEAVATSLVYNGDTVRLTLAHFVDSAMTVIGNGGVTAGDYICAVALKDTSVYAWSNGSKDTVFIAWKITRAALNKPIATTTQYKYTGSLITLALQSVDAAKMTVTNDTATAVGEYSCMISLNDTANYMWNDGAATDVAIVWKITADGKTLLQKPGGWHSHTTYSESYTEYAETPIFFDSETMEIIGNNTLTGPGFAEFSVALKDKESYAWEDGTDDDVTVQIVNHYSMPNGDYSLSQIMYNDNILSENDLQHISAAAHGIYSEIKEKSFNADYGGKILFDDMKVTYFLDQGWNVVDVLTINADNKIEIWNHDDLEFSATTQLVFNNLFFIDSKIQFAYTDDTGKKFTFIFSLPSVGL